MQTNGKEPVSLYWHIPFCRKKCGYCHFYVLPDQERLKDELLEGFKLEWSLVQPRLAGKEILSVYFGGGTPSLFGAKRLETLLSLISAKGAEITLEANPTDLSLEQLKRYFAIGINRLSIGVQSFDDTLLQLLTRQHSASLAERGVERAFQAGFSNISIDLMYDIPNQTLQSWQRTLQRAASLPISHLSLYNLTIEPHTQFFKKREALQPRMPIEEVSLQMYLRAVEELESAGLTQYEISAFCREKPSCHNSGYWTGRAFHGFGPSAFSYWHRRRYRNVASQKLYLQALRSLQEPIDFEERLGEEASRRELLTIALRLNCGVDLESFTAQHGPLQSLTKETLLGLEREGYLLSERSTVKLTTRGRLCYDAIAAELI